MREIQRLITLLNLQRSHWIHEQVGQLTGLSETGQLLTDSFRIDGSHTDGVLRVRGQLGKQDVGFPPADLGLIMGKEKKKRCVVGYSAVPPLLSGLVLSSCYSV